MSRRAKRRLFLFCISPLIPVLFVADVTWRVWPRFWASVRHLWVSLSVDVRYQCAYVWRDIVSSWVDES